MNTQTKAEKVQAAQDQVNLITAEISQSADNKAVNDARFDQSTHVLNGLLVTAQAALTAAEALSE